jgi:hypothetical protein
MSVKRLLLIGVTAAWTAGCVRPIPVEVGAPVAFQHRTTAFTIDVPDGWTRLQDQVPTEALGIFADPTGQATIVAYVGLLDHRFDNEEGLRVVARLTANLLRRPDDYQITGQERRADGAFEVSFRYSRDEQKHAGLAVFRDTNLALSGVIITGSEDFWPRLRMALLPYAESFEFDPEVVRGAYFDILEDTYYILVVPIDWPRQRSRFGTEVRSRFGRMSIRLVQRDLGREIDRADLVDQTLATLYAGFNLVAKVLANEPQPDGRLKLTLRQANQQIIGYVETFDTHLVGIFFDVPGDRVEDYQPFMDFVYSMYISGLP